MQDLNHDQQEKPQGGWIDRHLPPFWRPYARLLRLDRPEGTWLLLLPCWWGVALAGGFHPLSMLLFSLGALVMRGAGCVINDLFDRKIDRAVARTATRPLASGEIGVFAALVFLAATLLVGLGILLCFEGPVVRLALGVMPLVALYPLAKRVLFAPQFILGLVFNWGALLGWVSVRGRIEWPAVALYAGGVLWTLAYDTIYAHQDKNDDIKIGVKSLALTLGEKSHAWVLGFFIGALCLFALAGAEAGMNLSFYLALGVALGHALWQVRGWQLDVPADCLARFKSNRDFGLILLVGIFMGLFV